MGVKIFGVKKVDFTTFSKLFRSCSGVVWALFSALTGPFCIYFLLERLISDPKNRNLGSNFAHFCGFEGSGKLRGVPGIFLGVSGALGGSWGWFWGIFINFEHFKFS